MKREYMAARGTVMEKTANMYMELIADVEKRGVSVCSACVRSEGWEGSVAGAGAQPIHLSSA